VIILQVNVNGILTVEPKSDAPVPGHAHGIGALPIAFELVETKAQKIHVLRLYGRIQSVEQTTDLLHVVTIKPARVVVSEKLLQSLVPERSNHIMCL
jgi:hypothetical protein